LKLEVSSNPSLAASSAIGMFEYFSSQIACSARISSTMAW